MTGTSKALKRLGVTGLGAAVMFAGLVPLTELAANAAAYPITTATSVSLSPDSDTAANGECNPFTVTIAPTNGSVSVNIQQSIPAAAAPTATTIGFCNPTTSPEGNSTVTQAGPEASAAGTTTTAAVNGTCTNNNNTAAAAGNVSCDTTYTDTNNDGKVTFGVTSNQPGTMSVTAFGDANGNGAADVGEAKDTSTKTWVVNNKNASSDKISCSPTSATNPAGAPAGHTIKCVVTDANGNALAGADNVKFVVTSGPDTNATPQGCSTTTDGTAGSVPGESTCVLNNGGTPGHDVVSIYLEQNGVSGQQAGEPSTTVTKDWVLAAPSTSTLTISCSPNQTGSTAPPGATANCTEPLTQNNVTLTALVQNGSPAQPVANVIVQFGQPVDIGGADAGDTESVSPTTCTTGANGQCSVTFNDTTPTNGEHVRVTGTLPTQGGGNPTATVDITYHAATRNEARNITVAPKTATQTSGGSQDFVATVTDRIGSPVPGVCVGFTEGGPGHFANTDTIACLVAPPFSTAGSYQTTCITSSAGQCTVTVVSQSTESGNETVTATIDANNYPGGAAGNRVECSAPADRTFTGTNNSTTTPPGDPATGAPAGNCSASGVVTWRTSTPPPPHRRVAISLKLSCFSHAKHHVTCVAQTRPSAYAGVKVIFYNGKGNRVGTDLTGRAGKAKLHLSGFKSGSKHRFQAHAKRSARTHSADSKQVVVKVA